MKGIRQLYNNQAMQLLNKRVSIPDAALAIDSGEELAPLPAMVVYPQTIKAPTMPDISNVNYERASIDGYAEPIKESDFPKTYYFGDAIGGM
jgi:hypothetical protein